MGTGTPMVDDADTHPMDKRREGREGDRREGGGRDGDTPMSDPRGRDKDTQARSWLECLGPLRED